MGSRAGSIASVLAAFWLAGCVPAPSAPPVDQSHWQAPDARSYRPARRGPQAQPPRKQGKRPLRSIPRNQPEADAPPYANQDEIGGVIDDLQAQIDDLTKTIRARGRR